MKIPRIMVYSYVLVLYGYFGSCQLLAQPGFDNNSGARYDSESSKRELEEKVELSNHLETLDEVLDKALKKLDNRLTVFSMKEIYELEGNVFGQLANTDTTDMDAVKRLTEKVRKKILIVSALVPTQNIPFSTYLTFAEEADAEFVIIPILEKVNGTPILDKKRSNANYIIYNGFEGTYSFTLSIMDVALQEIIVKETFTEAGRINLDRSEKNTLVGTIVGGAALAVTRDMNTAANVGQLASDFSNDLQKGKTKEEAINKAISQSVRALRVFFGETFPIYVKIDEIKNIKKNNFELLAHTNEPESFMERQVIELMELLPSGELNGNILGKAVISKIDGQSGLLSASFKDESPELMEMLNTGKIIVGRSGKVQKSWK